MGFPLGSSKYYADRYWYVLFTCLFYCMIHGKQSVNASFAIITEKTGPRSCHELQFTEYPLADTLDTGLFQPLMFYSMRRYHHILKPTGGRRGNEGVPQVGVGVKEQRRHDDVLRDPRYMKTLVVLVVFYDVTRLDPYDPLSESRF